LKLQSLKLEFYIAQNREIKSIDIMKSLPFLLILMVVLACNSKHISDAEREKVKSEMKNRELKKLLDADILNEGKRKSAMLADSAQALLLAELQRVIAEQGIEEAIPYCHSNAYKLVADVAGENGTTIKRVSEKNRNPENTHDATELEILEAYTYAAEQNIALTEEVRFSEDKRYVLYTKPIRMQSALCLNCHGTIGKEVLPAVADKIASLYPDDKAIGYQLGELRGMWSIKMPLQVVTSEMPEY
jgi:hypothetical protein